MTWRWCQRPMWRRAARAQEEEEEKGFADWMEALDWWLARQRMSSFQMAFPEGKDLLRFGISVAPLWLLLGWGALFFYSQWALELIQLFGALITHSVCITVLMGSEHLLRVLFSQRMEQILATPITPAEIQQYISSRLRIQDNAAFLLLLCLFVAVNVLEWSKNWYWYGKPPALAVLQGAIALLLQILQVLIYFAAVRLSARVPLWAMIDTRLIGRNLLMYIPMGLFAGVCLILSMVQFAGFGGTMAFYPSHVAVSAIAVTLLGAVGLFYYRCRDFPAALERALEASP